MSVGIANVAATLAVVEAVAVRADDREGVRAGHVGHPLLRGLTFRPGLGEARGQHDRAADAALCAGLDDVGHGDGGGEDHRHVDGLGQVVDGWVGGDAVDFGPFRVDREQAAGEVPVQVLEDIAAQRRLRRPDDGDGLRGEQPLDAGLAGLFVSRAGVFVSLAAQFAWGRFVWGRFVWGRWTGLGVRLCRALPCVHVPPSGTTRIIP